MCQHTAGGHWLGPAIGMLLLLLVTEPLAGGQGSPLHDADAATSATGHAPFALVTPLAVDDEALFAVERSIAAADADHRPFALVTPLAVEGNAPFAVGNVDASSAGRRWSAQASPSPGEVGPIPFEVGKGAEPEPWPYALPFLADRVIKQGYTLPCLAACPSSTPTSSGTSR